MMLMALLLAELLMVALQMAAARLMAVANFSFSHVSLVLALPGLLVSCPSRPRGFHDKRDVFCGACVPSDNVLNVCNVNAEMRHPNIK